MDSSGLILKTLIEKFVSNKGTKEEMDLLLKKVEKEENREEFTAILREFWQNSLLSQESLHKESKVDMESKLALLMKEINYQAPGFSINTSRSRINRARYAAAIVTIFLLSLAVYFLFRPANEKLTAGTEDNNEAKKVIVPGGNKAVLTLADGSIIILDSARNGALTTQAGTEILKLNGKLSYKNINAQNSEVVYNTISTPKGGQYQFILEDGSEVWLNAASSLRFPANFTGKERNVELRGEAYFEVAKRASMPFKIKLNGMEVEVLGTHLNINSYDDESIIRTTLLEGSVRINRNHEVLAELIPGQQVQMDKGGEMKILSDVNFSEAVAWKNENFQFNRDDIHSVMRQIARWYDVDVEYEGTVTTHFVGAISRSANISQVLKMLSMTGGVKFEIKDNKIKVIPNTTNNMTN